jgi:asparagine synthase (glutamine-hydrolysing)
MPLIGATTQFSSIIRSAGYLPELVRLFGLEWVLWRAGYALQMKTGLLKRRFPTTDLDCLRFREFVQPGTPTEMGEYRAFRQESAARFFFAPGHPPDTAALSAVAGESGVQRTLSVADDYARGRFLYYGRVVYDLGWPPDWLLNPYTGSRHDAGRHWCDTPTFSPALGDIKDVWEASRFACAFWLVRAYAMSGDERYPAAFWAMFESWCRQNPLNRGPHWKCGQETALRSMAWCFALFSFWRAEATTPQRVANLVKMLALQAERIAGNIQYAVSQKNNHALSEAIGLLTTAWLFPELKGARRWQALGLHVLEREAVRQIYADGSYVQQSMNYHRVMLHDCVWALRLAELNGIELSPKIIEAVGRAGSFLFEMLDRPSGRVPNYGANDGALVLPLSACDYLDYRPTVQAACYLGRKHPVLPAGPWDEMLIWLFGPHALAAPRQELQPTSRRFDAGGYYTLRAGGTWGLIRCHSFRDRPAHVDMLHLDLWHQGVNVLGDCGTYRYYAPEKPTLERGLRDIAGHNTVEIDGRGPLQLLSRFLWAPWPQARCLQHADRFCQGEHYAYDRSPWRVIHRRTVEAAPDGRWRITDELLGAGSHKVALRWHLADGRYRLNQPAGCLELELPAGRMLLTVQGPNDLRIEVYRGVQEKDLALGWCSEYYAELRPRPTLEISAQCLLPTRFVTEIDFGDHARP